MCRFGSRQILQPGSKPTTEEMRLSHVPFSLSLRYVFPPIPSCCPGTHGLEYHLNKCKCGWRTVLGDLHSAVGGSE